MDEDKLGMKMKTDRHTDGEEKINLDWKCLERGNEEERIRTGPSSFIQSGLNLKEDELWNNYTTKAEGCFEQHDANVADYRLQTNERSVPKHRSDADLYFKYSDLLFHTCMGCGYVLAHRAAVERIRLQHGRQHAAN